MTLLSRIHANQCTVVGCSRTRATGIAVCVEDANRLVARPQPVVETAWQRYVRERQMVRVEWGRAA